MEKTFTQPGNPWIEYLISGYVQETLQASERRELNEWVDASKDNQHLFEDMAIQKIMDALLQWETKLAAGKDPDLKELCN